MLPGHELLEQRRRHRKKERESTGMKGRVRVLMFVTLLHMPEKNGYGERVREVSSHTKKAKQAMLHICYCPHISDRKEAHPQQKRSQMLQRAIETA